MILVSKKKIACPSLSLVNNPINFPFFRRLFSSINAVRSPLFSCSRILFLITSFSVARMIKSSPVAISVVSDCTALIVLRMPRTELGVILLESLLLKGNKGVFFLI